MRLSQPPKLTVGRECLTVLQESVGPILKHKPFIMVHTSNPSAQKVEA